MPTSGVSEQLPDSELWQAVCQGSVPAFEVIVRRYQGLVCAVAYSACGDLASSEDVAQEAFWTAWRQRASIAEPGRLRAWLCGIARNLGHNARRRATAALPAAPLESAAGVPAREAGPAEAAVSREEEALLWRALEQMPQTYREPLVLFYRQEQSVAEVAAALDLSPEAVKQRLSRGRGLLQERVAQLVEAALRRSRPGRSFTGSVLAGLATVLADTGTALAAGGAAGPLVKAAAAGVATGVTGGVLGTLGGLLGAWLGGWVPSQLAPTRPESQYLRRRGKRIFLATVLLTGLLALPIGAFVAGRLSLATYLILLGAWIVGLWCYLGVEMALMAPGLKRIRADAANAEPNDAPLRVAVDAFTSRYRGRVFRSRWSFLGLPLLDVHVSDPPRAGQPAQRRVARGWVAIGDEAYGVLFALGGRACGLIALGGVAVGLIAVGGVALGGLAVGGFAAGVVGIGGLALGWQACGGGAIGWDLACGGAAVAAHGSFGGAAVAHDHALGGAAWAAQANNPVAEEVLFANPLAGAFKRLVTGDTGFIVLLFLVLPALLLASCLVPWLLMYRREPAPCRPPPGRDETS